MRLAVLLLILTHLAASAQDIRVRVDPAGPGSITSLTDYTTVQQALDHAPQPPAPFRLIIEIVPGTYHERILVTQNRPRVTLLGLGTSPADVVITNSLNAKQAGGTFFTETAEINGDAFAADNLTFANTAGNTGQAVAAAVRADRAVFKHVRFLGDQDTLFADFGRQYYLHCFLEGGVDFIFGNASAVFDHAEIRVLRRGYVTAQSRTSPTQTTGFVITRSRITADIASRSTPLPSDLTQTALVRDGFFLGRPWRAFSRVIVMETELPPELFPSHWSPWMEGDPTPKAFYAEFRNAGAGALSRQVAPWTHTLTAAEAKAFEPANFLAGPPSGPAHWDPVAAAAALP